MLLLIDDLFLLHDFVSVRYLGVAESAWYLFYVVIMASLILVYRDHIRSSNFAVLMLSIACFGLSVGFDVLSGFTWVTGLFLFEDGFKLLGIVGWAVYLVSECSRSLVAEGRPSHPNAGL